MEFSLIFTSLVSLALPTSTEIKITKAIIKTTMVSKKPNIDANINLKNCFMVSELKCLRKCIKNVYLLRFYKTMKKIVPLFLLSLFVYNIVGYTLLFKIEQYQAKEAIEEKIKSTLPENLLTVVEVKKNKKNEFQFLDFDEKELIYKGNRYDIVKTISTKDATFYYLLNDKQEQKLVTELEKNVKDNSENTNNSNKNEVVKKVVKDYFFETALHNIITTETKIQFSPLLFSIADGFNSLATPPPQLV